jgi:protein SCO1/2
MTRSRLRVALCVTAVCVGASGCRPEAGPPAPATDARAPAPSPGAAADDASVFALDVTLVDQDGTRAQLEDLAGHLTVATMMYASCTSVCPRVTEDMKAIERQLGSRAKDIRFVLFSLDPGRDTPRALRQFATDHHLDLARWRLFAASEDGVRDLAAVLGVKYAPESSGDIAHSAIIVVVDRQGVVRHRQLGVGQDPSALLDAVAGATD